MLLPEVDVAGDQLEIVFLRQARRLEVGGSGGWRVLVATGEEAFQRVAGRMFAGDVVEVRQVHLGHLGGVRDRRTEE
jgi:hypothetical protein